MTRTRRSSGFTLLELTVVISVIAIVASISLPIVIDARVKAEQTAATALFSRIIHGCETHMLKHNAYGPLGKLVEEKLLDIELMEDPPVGVVKYFDAADYAALPDAPGDVARSGAYHFVVGPDKQTAKDAAWQTYEVHAFPQDYPGPDQPYAGRHIALVYKAIYGTWQGLDLTTDPPGEVPIE